MTEIQPKKDFNHQGAADKKLRILLSAVACQPNRGSEPGVGWSWVRLLSKEHQLLVLTRTDNKKGIEDALRLWPEDRKRHLEFLYYDPPPWVVWLVRKRWLPAQMFYIAWEVGVYFHVRSRLSNIDLIHHVTLNTFLCTGLWPLAHLPLVLGPLGGSSIPTNEFMRLYPIGGRFIQRIRAWLVRHWRCLPWVRWSFAKASCVIAANSDAANLFKSGGNPDIPVMLETGVWLEDLPPLEPAEASAQGSAPTVRFIVLGGIEPHKGWRLALEAARLLRETCPDGWHLQFVGAGREMAAAISLTRSLHLERLVEFTGQSSFSAAQDCLRRADVLLFPSIKDTSGNVVLEAKKFGKPVICFRHQGVADITSDETAIRITPRNLMHSSADLAKAMEALLHSRDLRRELGQAGRKRLEQRFLWDAKREIIGLIYARAVENFQTRTK